MRGRSRFNCPPATAPTNADPGNHGLPTILDVYHSPPAAAARRIPAHPPRDPALRELELRLRCPSSRCSARPEEGALVQLDARPKPPRLQHPARQGHLVRSPVPFPSAPRPETLADLSPRKAPSPPSPSTSRTAARTSSPRACCPEHRTSSKPGPSGEPVPPPSPLPPTPLKHNN